MIVPRRRRNTAWRIPSLTWDDVDLEIRWIDTLQEIVEARGNPHLLHYAVWYGTRCVHRTRPTALTTAGATR